MTIYTVCLEHLTGINRYGDNSNAEAVEEWWKEHDGHKKAEVNIEGAY